MKIPNDKTGLSVLEIFCITVISVILVLMAVAVIRNLNDCLDNGNDSLMANTAESVARVNMTANGCVVNECNGGTNCTHENSNGNKVGYYEAVTHRIVAAKPSGYNEFGIMRIDGIYYKGTAGTVIISVTSSANKISLKWIKGDNA